MIDRRAGGPSYGSWPRRAATKVGQFVVVFATVLALDSLAGLAVYSDRSPTVHVTYSRSGQAAEALVVFPGFIMPGARLSAAFAPHLPANEAMIVIQYPQRGVDTNVIFDAAMDQLRKLNVPRVRVYGASMGGMAASDFLTRYVDVGSPFGPAVLVLDTAPSSYTDVKMPASMFALTSIYRGGPLASAIWAILSASPDVQAEYDADPINIAAARSEAAWAGMPAITSEAAYIRGFRRPDERELTPFTARAVYLQGRFPNREPLIRVQQAITGWRYSFPDLTVFTIRGRMAGWHVPLIERPHEAVTAILSV